MPTIDYVAKKIKSTIKIDGNIQKVEWQKAVWTRRFVDLVSGRPAMYDTRAAILWNDTHLYIAFSAEEPYVEAHLVERDSIVFLESDLEVFIEGDDCYYELEVNAANTIYEVFHIWKDAYTSGSRFNTPEFDIHQANAYTFGGDYDRTGKHFWKGTHPRGVRWAFTNFDMPGLQTAVKVNGTLNDSSDVDKGWDMEIAIPWKSLQLLANERTIPPSTGDVWSMFLGRFQKLELSGKEIQPHPAMALNSHGTYDTHLPEHWSRIQFLK